MSPGRPVKAVDADQLRSCMDAGLMIRSVAELALAAPHAATEQVSSLTRPRAVSCQRLLLFPERSPQLDCTLSGLGPCWRAGGARESAFLARSCSRGQRGCWCGPHMGGHGWNFCSVLIPMAWNRGRHIVGA